MSQKKAYTAEFKEAAVKLAVESEQSVNQTARELEVNVNTLHTWIAKYCTGPDLPGTVIEHGPYHRNGLAERVRAIRPHAGAVFSVWPETWCHTLTEMWAAGLPVLGFDIGAVGDRLRQSNAGWLVNELTASAVADKLPAIRQEWSQKHSAVLKWQQQQGLQQSCAAMAKQYWSQYCKLLM
ncbi:transposase [Oceanimonas smirnovii]|uniref:transposase n=1 Tax=Oceanimonas smirnovii TaxID=264574 RepID=UPI00376F7166